MSTVRVPSRRAIARLDYVPGTVDIADEVPCPACGQRSWLLRSFDRAFHMWGEDNRRCWAEISSGRADHDLVVEVLPDRHDTSTGINAASARVHRLRSAPCHSPQPSEVR